MDCPTNDLTNDLIEALSCTSYTYFDTLADYCRLSVQSDLSDRDVERLDCIYAQAEADPNLNFFIHELDAMLAERLGLLDTAQIEQYSNQQAWLREHLEGVPYDKAYREEVQMLLSKRGFYGGPIDGVLGDRSRIAVQKFQATHALKVDGVPGRVTFTALQTR